MGIKNTIMELCPALYASDSLDFYINMAVRETDREKFGVVYQDYIAFYACHLYTLFSEENASGGGGSNIPGTVGEVSSISEGGVSISYFQSGTGGGSASSSTRELEGTKFGKMCLMLRNRILRMGVNRT